MKRKKRVNLKNNLKEYLHFLKKYKFLTLLLLFLVFVIEGITLGERYLFKILVDKGTAFEAGSVTKDVFLNVLWFLLFVFLVAIISKVVLKWFNLHLINKIEVNLIADLKRKYFDHLIELSHGFHVTHKTGSLISRLSRGGRAVERMTDNIVFNFAPLVFQLVISSISLVFLDLTSAIVLSGVIIVFLGTSYYFQRIQEPANIKANLMEDIEKANIADIFTNIDSIRYFGKEDYIKNKFFKLSSNTSRHTLIQWNYSRWFSASETLILAVGTLLMIIFPLVKFLGGAITLGTLVFIYTIYLNLLGPMFGFVHGMREVYRTMIDFDDLFEYGKVEKEVKDKLSAKRIKIEYGEIGFKNVSFSYGNRRIFNNLNLSVKKNEKVALVGHSGSGKTTLVKLLYRFYDLNKGKILIDGGDISDFKQESLRSEMSVVPQECVLFDDTIYNNISFSKPRAEREEVMKAIKFAQLDKIINKFPNKEDTIVGERGLRLSGGEKQRVSIARAILANKKILVLDEATSSLDSETEHEIQKDLFNLMKGRTTIIIAHRLSTIMRADKIVVMKNGKIVQMGKHRDLIKESGEYRKLWSLQKGGYLQDK